MANQRPNLNFIIGAGISIAVADNPGLDATDVTISATGGGAGVDGWVDPGVTWTYASATTFTVSGDATTIYEKGVRIKLTQTAVKYFVVVASSHSGGTTTVTITGGSDYTLANAAIAANYYSRMLKPQGYPSLFNYTPSIVSGFSGSLSVFKAQFAVVGKMLTLIYNWSGTSNGATFVISPPVAIFNGIETHATRITDNGADLTTPGRVGGVTTEIRFGALWNAAGGFTTSGTKGAAGVLSYEI